MVRAKPYEVMGAVHCSCGRHLYRTAADFHKCTGCGYVPRHCSCPPLLPHLKMGDPPPNSTDVRWWSNRRQWAQRQRR